MAFQREDDARRFPTIRKKLAVLVISCILPSVVGIGLLIFHFYDRERAQLERDSLQTARALTAAVDRDLGVGENVALALAASPSLATQDFAAFHAQAKSLLRDEFPASNFVLSDESGQQVVNTARAFGDPLPFHGNPGQIRRLFETGKPVISDLFQGSVLRRPLVTIDVPVTLRGKVAYDLTVAFLPERLGRVLAEQRLPPGRIVAILDTKGVIVARNRLPEKYVGQQASPALAKRITEETEGTLENTTLEGIPVFTAFNRSMTTGWTVVIGIPQAMVLSELLQSLSFITLAVLALCAGGFGTAWVLGGRIGRSVRALTAPALALGRGQPVVGPTGYFKEAVEVACALKTVERELEAHRHHLEALVDERTAALAHANRVLEDHGKRQTANRDFVSCILDSVSSNIAILDADGTIAEVNRPWKSFAQGNGMAPGWTGVGDNYLTICRAAEGEEVAAGIEAVMSGKRGEFALEYPCDSPDQRRRFQMRVTPLKDGEGRVVVSHDDISGLKRAENALRESEDRLALATQAAGIGVWDWNLATNAMLWSAEVFSQLGVLATEAQPGLAVFRSLTAEGDRQRFDREIDAALRGDKAFDAEIRIIRPDGALRVLRSAAQVFRDPDGAPIRMVGIIYDITDRKMGEIRLSELLDLNQKIITECPVGIVAHKASGECVLANGAYARLMGGNLDEILSSNFLELRSWKDVGLLDCALEALASGDLRQTSVHHVTPFGREVWAEVFLIPFTAGGEPHLLCIKSDVSEQAKAQIRLQELNEQLVAARDSADAASRAKSEFVANMSHEIRTPMNAIMGLSRLLEDSSLSGRERDYVGKIKLSAQSLLGILNDILDFSKIEAGRLELEQAPFSLNQVLRSLSAVVSTNARDKGIETIFALEPDMPVGLRGDSLRLQQVLLNLTGNAVKFTERGEVVLSVRKLAEDEAGVTLEFAVRDTGIGIPADKQAGLFSAFAQADSSTSRRFGGTGLGLTISTRLVALMGGGITFTSQFGQGSDFRFTARFGLSDEPEKPPFTQLGDLDVLVVDDNDTAREVLLHTCRSFRWHTEAAAEGGAALDLLRQHTAEERNLDILLLDWRMPGMDGIELLKRATADPAIRLPPVILMVTAFGAEAIAPTAEGLRIDGILAKPVTPSSIFDAVARIRGGATVADRASELPSLAGLRVMVVEDNDINQDVAREILSRAGADVTIAGDGQSAVDLLTAAAMDFDAVLMDVQMPGMDGYEATRIIRGALGLTALPIIAMTANAMASDRQKSALAGMNAHIAKPIDVEELITCLTSHVPGIGRLDIPAGLASPPETPTDPPGIDLRTALVRLGGDRTLFLSLLGKFQESQGAAVAEVRSLLARGMDEDAANLLHRFRGIAANLGANEVARLATEAEAAIKEVNPETLPGLLTGIEAAMALVIDGARGLTTGKPDEAASVDPATLREGLARLLPLLRNSDLKAMDEFEALRPFLAWSFGPDAAKDLADRMERLDFAGAEQHIQKMRT